MSSSYLSAQNSRYGTTMAREVSRTSSSYAPRTYSTSHSTSHIAPTRYESTSRDVTYTSSRDASYTTTSRDASIHRHAKWGIRVPVSEAERHRVEDELKRDRGQWGGATVTTEHDAHCLCENQHRNSHHQCGHYHGPNVLIVGHDDQVLHAKKKLQSVIGHRNEALYNRLDVDLTHHQPNRYHEVGRYKSGEFDDRRYSYGTYNKWGHKVPCTETGRQKIEDKIQEFNRVDYRGDRWGGATVSTEIDGCYGPTVRIQGNEEQVIAGKKKVAAILGDHVGDHSGHGENLHYGKIELHPRYRWEETVAPVAAPVARKPATVHVQQRQVVQQQQLVVTESEGEY